MCCWFDASDCGNGEYGADCYASLLLTQVNHSAAEAWLVLSGARGWMSNALLQMHYGRGALGWDVRIIKDRCVGLAQQTRHTDTWNCPAQVKPNTSKVWFNGKKQHLLSALHTFGVWGKDENWIVIIFECLRRAHLDVLWQTVIITVHLFSSGIIRIIVVLVLSRRVYSHFWRGSKSHRTFV